MREQGERTRRVARGNAIEEVTERLPAAHANDIGDGSFVDRPPTRIARELVELRGERRELVAHGLLQQLRGLWTDRGAQLALDVVNDPLRHAIAAERFELHR